MIKLKMIGTGNGTTLNLYNTCFLISNEEGDFLIDTGGSIEIVKRLKEFNIELKDIHNIFISHSHTDHILGLIWIFKKIGVMLMDNEQLSKINIYCNENVYETIKVISKYVLPDKLMELIYSVCNFIILNDNDKYIINGIEYIFFDIKARGTKQFGFKTIINNKKLIFLGDEPLNPILYERIKDADYVMHEAFCLDSEENIFHAYEKHHSTVKSACEVMDKLNIKNLILYHTEDSHGNERKKLYLDEGNKYFKGNLLVPDDMEEIIIE